MLGGFGGLDGADDDGLERDFARVLRLGEQRIFVHHTRQQRLVE